MCPENYFVDAFQARIEPKQGSKDDTALNGLNFRCKNPATSDNKIMILYLNYLLFYNKLKNFYPFEWNYPFNEF